MEEWHRLLRARIGDAPSYGSGAWRRAFETTPDWELLGSEHFSHRLRRDVDGLVDLAASVSYVAALPEADHRAVRDAVRRLLREHPATRGCERIDLPYRTDVYAYGRLDEESRA